MDFQTPLIVVVLFVIASVTLFFVYKFGIKEKSYEEALAEQRQQTQTLLGVVSKPKKKSKKAAKKAKDNNNKQASSSSPAAEIETADDESETNTDHSTHHHQKLHHVDFKEVVAEEEVAVISTRNKNRNKKVGSILLNKNQQRVGSGGSSVKITNHFEEIHPKDEFERLLLSSSANDNNNATNKVIKEPVVEPIAAAAVITPTKSTQKSELSAVETVKSSTVKSAKILSEISKATNVVKRQADTATVTAAATAQPPPPSTAADIKNASSDSANISPTNSGGGNTGKEKKKKKSEFNTLQQLTAGGDSRDGLNVSLLLNLVRKAELSRSEVQILIDLLLNKQHEAPAIIDEWSEGKSDPVQKLKKQLAEKEKALLEEQEALVGAQAKLRDVRAEQLSERTQLQQKIRGYEEVLQTQQLEVQASTNRYQNQTMKLQQLQTQLNDELLKNHKLHDEYATIQMQRQQFELRLTQAQEAEVSIGQLRNEMQEISSHNQQLRLELQRLSEESVVEQERSQAYINQLKKYQKDFEVESERNRQLEDTRKDLEHRLETMLRQESDIQRELSHLNTTCKQQAEELRHGELVRKQIQDEFNRVQKLKDDEIAKNVAQYQFDLQRLEDEKNTYLTANNDLSAKNAEVESSKVLKLHNELNLLKVELKQVETNYQNVLDSSRTIQCNLDEQIDKNNTLRIRNWKVMEALKETESRNNKLKSEIIQQEQNTQRQFLQRLFPDIKELNDLTITTTTAAFHLECEKYIQEYLKNLLEKSCVAQEQQQEVEKGDDNVASSQEVQEIHLYYKNVIDSAEKRLNRLYTEIGQEENNWRVQLAEKTAEIDTLKQRHAVELEEKLSNLYAQLKLEQDEKERIVKLKEEVNYLREQLQNEETKNNNSSNSSNGVNAANKSQLNGSTTTNGSSALIQHCLSSSSSIASSVNEVSVVKKTKNKKKKKKGNGN